jgi:hypothetical protein
MKHRAVAVGLIGAFLGAAALSAAAHPRSAGPAPGPHAGPAIDPTNFVRHVTNPFFPLKPGTLLVYRGVKDGQMQTDRVYVTHLTKVILGVRATVVRDVATHRGHPLEKTFDWFAQDTQGNVWYFGEDTEEFLPNGRVSTEGSWQAGVHGARPGIVMEADPHVADGYRQEFYRGHAEDQAWVLTRGGTVLVPYGRLHHVLVTLEWTPLEPTVIDRKVYARGIGIVREASTAGPVETAELVRVRHLHG